MLRAFLLSFLLASALSLHCQVDMENFALYGEAIRLNDECFRLTEDVNYASGSIQYKVPIDLNQPFQMEMEVFLGCRDGLGADGIVFIFYPRGAQLGFRGEGMGFGGLAPSLGIELDTYFNDHLLDPEEDHATIMFNGQTGHWQSEFRPVRLPNLEDCNYHPMEISWRPAEQNLSVYLDGRRVINFTGDLINGIFNGNSLLYWGASAATGRKRNRQEVCFRKLILGEVKPLPTLDPDLKRRFLAGQSIQLPDFKFNSGEATLTETHKRYLSVLAGMLGEDPDLKLRVFVHTDASGDEKLNQSLSDQRARAIYDYLLSEGIPPERLFAKGFGEMYPRQANATTRGLLSDRRVEFALLRAIP